MLQLHPVYSLCNRHKTLTGSPDPTCANGTNKPCSNNDIMNIADGAFSDMRRCKKFWLNSNELTYIKNEMLEGLESLQFLNLQYNKIRNIHASAFDHIPHCTELWLYANELTYIRTDTFEKLPQLAKLERSKNRLFDIEPGAFTKRKMLKLLHLHHNRLTTLQRNVFSSQHQTNLTLFLSVNPLLCDSTMCWIKWDERDGWIALDYTQNDDFWNKPDCTNYPDRDWDDITLSCPPESRYISTEMLQTGNFNIPFWG